MLETFWVKLRLNFRRGVHLPEPHLKCGVQRRDSSFDGGQLQLACSDGWAACDWSHKIKQAVELI